MMNHINDCKNTIIFALCLLFSANWASAQKDSTGVRKDTVAKVELIKEVSINARKKVFETDKGKLIFNVQNSALSTGQTALDLLKRVPGVSVGQNDQILFRGSPGINVVIDGKMTYLLGSQLASFLMGMSAEDITKIEIMTTPSSEFDAAGNAGIINIISRKNIKKGYAIDLRSSVSKGKYWMNNQNITSSFRTKKINLYSSFDFNTPHSYSKNQSGNTITDNGTVLQLSRNNESIYKVKYYTWRIGADWQFLARHSIGISYNGYFDDFKSFNYSTVDRLDHLGNLQSYIRSENKQ
ncbi:TonB-dependent receptor plug domain-containing protein, partial [uncultured Chryseobacterium sp.]|uniref:TonB-dependent receptor plug domain-containing protein n=1 Tax=uncultured Chryseobacterium sp. TaxID=259322 RepID=UPI0025DCA389